MESQESHIECGNSLGIPSHVGAQRSHRRPKFIWDSKSHDGGQESQGWWRVTSFVIDTPSYVKESYFHLGFYSLV